MGNKPPLPDSSAVAVCRGGATVIGAILPNTRAQVTLNVFVLGSG